MVEDRPTKKPPHVSKERWKEHLTWMDVMSKQVEENQKVRVPRPGAQSISDKEVKSPF